MQFSLFNLYRSDHHACELFAMMRGEVFQETLGVGDVAVLVVLGGSATISRQRQGELVGLHITPGRLRPVFLTTPGTYCVVARDHLIGTRLLRRAEGAQT